MVSTVMSTGLVFELGTTYTCCAKLQLYTWPVLKVSDTAFWSGPGVLPLDIVFSLLRSFVLSSLGLSLSVSGVAISVKSHGFMLRGSLNGYLFFPLALIFNVTLVHCLMYICSFLFRLQSKTCFCNGAVYPFYVYVKRDSWREEHIPSTQSTTWWLGVLPWCALVPVYL